MFIWLQKSYLTLSSGFGSHTNNCYFTFVSLHWPMCGLLLCTMYKLKEFLNIPITMKSYVNFILSSVFTSLSLERAELLYTSLRNSESKILHCINRFKPNKIVWKRRKNRFEMLLILWEKESKNRWDQSRNKPTEHW